MSQNEFFFPSQFEDEYIWIYREKCYQLLALLAKKLNEMGNQKSGRKMSKNHSKKLSKKTKKERSKYRRKRDKKVVKKFM